MININDAVEMSSRGYGNTLTNSQRVLINAYIQCVLEEENEGNKGYNWVMEMTDLFEVLLNKL